MNLLKLLLLLLISIITVSSIAEEKKDSTKDKKSFEEKEAELLDFKSLKNVLKKDKLTEQVEKKVEKIKVVKKKREEKKREEYRYPPEGEFWRFLSELWLIKNAQKLKWDFEKPDFGLDVTLMELFRKLGYLDIKFKILIVNSTAVPHFAFPSIENEYVFIVSLPFMRTLDLTKQEIALLLLENFFRIQKDYLKKRVMTAELLKVIGSNFHSSKKVDVSLVDKALSRIDHFVYKKGYNLQQMFEITKEMDTFLKTYPILWNSYGMMLRRIDTLVKNNLMYDSYTRIYPSPEMQLNWFYPKKKTTL